MDVELIGELNAVEVSTKAAGLIPEFIV